MKKIRTRETAIFLHARARNLLDDPVESFHSRCRLGRGCPNFQVGTQVSFIDLVATSGLWYEIEQQQRSEVF